MEQKKSFNEEWEYVHSTQEWGMYPAEHVIRFVARNYYKEERDKVRILDFGCGAGAHTWYLAREGFDVYAFDGSKSAIEKAEHRFAREHLSAKFKVADALEAGYADEFFDAVIDNVCIYGNVLENIHIMYRDVYRMLCPGGRLLTTCFGKRTDGYGTGEKIEEDTYQKITEGALVGRGTTHFFTREALEDTLKQAGFSDVHVDCSLYTDNGVQIEQFIATAVKQCI